MRKSTLSTNIFLKCCLEKYRKRTKKESACMCQENPHKMQTMHRYLRDLQMQLCDNLPHDQTPWQPQAPYRVHNALNITLCEIVWSRTDSISLCMVTLMHACLHTDTHTQRHTPEHTLLSHVHMVAAVLGHMLVQMTNKRSMQHPWHESLRRFKRLRE